MAVIDKLKYGTYFLTRGFDQRKRENWKGYILYQYFQHPSTPKIKVKGKKITNLYRPKSSSLSLCSQGLTPHAVGASERDRRYLWSRNRGKALEMGVNQNRSTSLVKAKLKRRKKKTTTATVITAWMQPNKAESLWYNGSSLIKLLRGSVMLPS